MDANFKMTARRHHYVPQCYLKGFCRYRNKPRLFVVDVRQLRTFTTPPANVAAERDFHSVEIDGLPSDAFENAFSKFESGLSQSLERIIATRSIAHETDHANLLNLVAAIAVKNPTHRESFRHFEEQVIKQIMHLATATRERWEDQMRRAKAAGYVKADADTDYERMKGFVDCDEYNIKLSPGHHLQLELSAIDKILPLLFARKWLLLRAPKGSSGFVTCDYPACLMWSGPERRNNFFPPGHGLHGTQLVFPVSRELAIIGAFELFDEERDADENLIAASQYDHYRACGAPVLRARRRVRLLVAVSGQNHARNRGNKGSTANGTAKRGRAGEKKAVHGLRDPASKRPLKLPPEQRLRHRVIELPLEQRALADHPGTRSIGTRFAVPYTGRPRRHRRTSASRPWPPWRVLAHPGQR
jgi:Protein of unknown function (DUF4238)